MHGWLIIQKRDEYMSIWSYDIIRADGNLFAYIRIQDDYTGNIAGRFSKVHQSGF